MELKAFYARSETILVGIVLAFPLLGTFFPIETYLNPTTSQEMFAQAQTETFDFSHFIMVGVEIFSIYLLVAHLRGMLRGALRGLLLIALVLLVFLSCAWATDPGTAFKRALRFFVYAVFALYLFQKYEIRDLTRFMTRVLAVPVYASFAIILINPRLGFSSYLGDPYAVRGALLDKNACGDLMGFAVLTAGYSFASRINNRVFSGSVLLGSLILVAAAPSTTSRLVVLATTALALYAWLVRNRAKPAWGIIASIWTALGVGVLAFVIIDFNDVLKLVGKNATLTGRTDIWRAILHAIPQRPYLGFGYAFWNAPSMARTNIWYEIGFAPPHAHNNWLDVILQLGFVGLLITAAFWLVALARGIRLGLFTREPGAIFMLLIIINLFIRSWTESVMLEPADMLWMWFVIAYLYLSRMSVANRKRKQAAVASDYSAYPVRSAPQASVVPTAASNAVVRRL